MSVERPVDFTEQINNFRAADEGEEVRQSLIDIALMLQEAINEQVIDTSTLDALGTLRYVKKLTSEDDVDERLAAGTYFVDSDSLPQNWPLPEAGRLLVITSGTGSLASEVEIIGYYNTDATSIYSCPCRLMYRVHPNTNASGDDWSGINWEFLWTLSDESDRGVLSYQRKLDSNSSVNARISPGTYYVDLNSYPNGWPFKKPGRLLVITSGSWSAACEIQIAGSSDGNIAYRVNINDDFDDGDEGWRQVDWVYLKDETAESLAAQSVANCIPWVRGTLSSVDNKYNVAADTTGTRIRTLSTVRNVRNLKLSGYQCKRYYYSDYYGVGDDVEDLWESKDAFWQNMATGVSTRPGKWCHIIIRKPINGTIIDGTANDAEITDADLADIRSKIQYTMLPESDDLPVFQMQTLPWNAATYHALWTALLDGNRVVRRDLGANDESGLGDVVYDNENYPMYMYEIHAQRDYIVSGSGGNENSRIAYNGSNAMYPRPKILILAGVHGNEKNTPMDAYKLAVELLSGSLQELAATCDFYFIPLLNPWGYSHARLDSEGGIIYDGGVASAVVNCSASINAGIRFNGANEDINRDYSDTAYNYTVTIEGESVTKELGWKTQELKRCKHVMTGTAWDAIIDLHQNHENKSAAPAANQCCTFTAISHAATGMSENAVKKLRRLWRELDACNAGIDKKLKAFFRRGTNTEATRIKENSAEYPTSSRYFAGLSADGLGNTAHTEIATARAYVVESSEVAMIYSGLANQWYNPAACTVSTTTTVDLIKSIIESINREA